MKLSERSSISLDHNTDKSRYLVSVGVDKYDDKFPSSLLSNDQCALLIRDSYSQLFSPGLSSASRSPASLLSHFAGILLSHGSSSPGPCIAVGVPGQTRKPVNQPGYAFRSIVGTAHIVPRSLLSQLQIQTTGQVLVSFDQGLNLLPAIHPSSRVRHVFQAERTHLARFFDRGGRSWSSYHCTASKMVHDVTMTMDQLYVVFNCCDGGKKFSGRGWHRV